jgi:hypothetical protein
MHSDQQLRWRQIIVVGSLVALIAWSLVLLVAGVPAAQLFPNLLKFGLVSTIVLIAWMFFVKKAWRLKWVRTGRWLVATPDLNGRWTGSSVSTFDGKERRMTLEIRQSLLRVHCVGFGPGNRAQGYSARILCDPEEETFKLAFLYSASREVTTSVAGDQHEGVAVLSLSEGPPRRLRGYYVNNRDPEPRKADIDLKWESARLKDEL